MALGYHRIIQITNFRMNSQLCRTSILIRGLETCYAIFWAITLATIQKKKLLATYSLEIK